MNQLGPGNSKARGDASLASAPAKKFPPRPPATLSTEKKESEIRFKTTDGTALRGTPVRVTRHTVVFELYSPSSLPRFSEALTDFKVNLQDRAMYSGRAIVRNVVDAGSVVTCEVKLTESDWAPLALTIAQAFTHGNLVREFKSFLAEWQKSYKILPEFKVAIADLQMILMELRLWLDKVQLEIDSQPREVRGQIERMLISDLRDLILRSVGHLLEKFELVTQKIGPEDRPAHFVLLDFNEETLNSTSNVLERLAHEHERATKIETMKKSVQQILKEGSKLESSFEKFDIVYCAGLFDYLSDNVCEKLLEFFYHVTAPGGLVVATNVADINPSRGWMEYMLDWHLIYRSVQGFRDMVPKGIDAESAVV